MSNFSHNSRTHHVPPNLIKTLTRGRITPQWTHCLINTVTGN
jgi:hypothetical protein